MVWYLIALEITCLVIIGVAAYYGSDWYYKKNPTPTPTISSLTPAYTTPSYTTPSYTTPSYTTNAYTMPVPS